MISDSIATRLHAAHPENAIAWWQNLPSYWKIAFNQTVLGKGAVITLPDETEILKILNATTLRLAGPRAPYPNMSDELPNLAGLEGLEKVEVLVVTHHQISDLRGIEQLTRLKSLFLYNNRIGDLKGLEKLNRLEELYIQNNEVRSLAALRQLTKLRKLYCSNNALTSLEGITAAHSKSLAAFHCLPNDNLPQKEIIRLENRFGIRCLKG